MFTISQTASILWIFLYKEYIFVFEDSIAINTAIIINEITSFVCHIFENNFHATFRRQGVVLLQEMKK